MSELTVFFKDTESVVKNFPCEEDARAAAAIMIRQTNISALSVTWDSVEMIWQVAIVGGELPRFPDDVLN